ncbi:hypothetical protein AC244_14225 [Ensifer adhaerens]|uniref:Uncharacterized protein n=1 Tax=Ensifer adhaerens TaxID=106592 RepID=A0A0L8BUX4_ENSAD|nr:hypothetical protein AC244_14225 [Ensifer adhaerens]
MVPSRVAVTTALLKKSNPKPALPGRTARPAFTDKIEFWMNMQTSFDLKTEEIALQRSASCLF